MRILFSESLSFGWHEPLGYNTLTKPSILPVRLVKSGGSASSSSSSSLLLLVLLLVLSSATISRILEALRVTATINQRPHPHQVRPRGRSETTRRFYLYISQPSVLTSICGGIFGSFCNIWRWVTDFSSWSSDLPLFNIYTQFLVIWFYMDPFSCLRYPKILSEAKCLLQLRNLWEVTSPCFTSN